MQWEPGRCCMYTHQMAALFCKIRRNGRHLESMTAYQKSDSVNLEEQSRQISTLGWRFKVTGVLGIIWRRTTRRVWYGISSITDKDTYGVTNSDTQTMQTDVLVNDVHFYRWNETRGFLKYKPATKIICQSQKHYRTLFTQRNSSSRRVKAQ